MKEKLPAWLVLTVICVVAAALLAGTNMLTKDVIAENTMKEKYATLMALMPDASDFEELESGVVIGKDGSGNAVGYSLAAVAQGFGGEVETTVAANPDGTISGISVGGANFAETAGLGARAKEPEFQDQFAGKSAPVALTKDGGEIEALSGATITSRAVIQGVNAAMEGIAAEAGFEMEEAAVPETAALPDLDTAEGTLYEGTAQGFVGKVKVTVKVDENNTITAIQIGDADFEETPGIGARVQEPEFAGQFIGMTFPITIKDIDAVSGATYSTEAVMRAITAIGDQLGGDGEAAQEKTEEAAPAEEENTLPDLDTAEGTLYEGTAQGYVGKVKVTVKVDENNTITAIQIGDADFEETPGIGARVQEPEFAGQFIGMTFPITIKDIDAVSGATYSTEAVMRAITAIGDQLGGENNE